MTNADEEDLEFFGEPVCGEGGAAQRIPHFPTIFPP
jgi:hypothetical protein